MPAAAQSINTANHAERIGRRAPVPDWLYSYFARDENYDFMITEPTPPSASASPAERRSSRPTARGTSHLAGSRGPARTCEWTLDLSELDCLFLGLWSVCVCPCVRVCVSPARARSGSEIALQTLHV